MTHYLFSTVAVIYWLLSSLLLFCLIRSEEFASPKQPNVFIDLGLCLFFGGLVTPLLIVLTTIYYGIALIKGD